MTGLTFPGGDPSSPNFPAQLDGLRDAIVPRLVLAWGSLAARAADYAATGRAVESGVFVVDADPEGLYLTVGPGSGDWVRLTKESPWAAGQIRVNWSTESRYSDAVTVTFPVGLFVDRPTVNAGTQNPLNAVAPVIFYIGKYDAEPPGAEITVADFQVQGACLDEGSTLGPGQWRYCHFSALVRTQGDGA